LENGVQFDSNFGQRPLVFRVGAKEVIQCWDEGFQQLRKGEHAILTCPSNSAYGSRGIPGVIPPNATLKFEVQVVDWKQ